MITAVFGLVGQDTLAVAASRITIPIEFLLQWHDESAEAYNPPSSRVGLAPSESAHGTGPSTR
jgi:hypothetical protein